MGLERLFEKLTEIAEIRVEGEKIWLTPKRPELRSEVKALLERLRPHKQAFLSYWEEKQRKQFEVALDRLASEFPAPPKEVESLSEEQRERFAIQAVDAWLTDEEALRYIH